MVFKKQTLINEKTLKNKLFQDGIFINWHTRWQKRLTKNKKSIELSLSLMRTANPQTIPRNHKVEEALDAASIKDDLIPLINLLKVLGKPYNERSGITAYQTLPPSSDHVYQTFCGT